MKSICALAGRVCPETNDATKKVYCPDWVVGVPEVERDGSGRLIAEVTYTGCVRPHFLRYLVGVTAAADHATASADKCANQIAVVGGALHGLITTAAAMVAADSPPSLPVGQQGLIAGEKDR